MQTGIIRRSFRCKKKIPQKAIRERESEIERQRVGIVSNTRKEGRREAEQGGSVGLVGGPFAELRKISAPWLSC